MYAGIYQEGSAGTSCRAPANYDSIVCCNSVHISNNLRLFYCNIFLIVLQVVEEEISGCGKVAGMNPLKIMINFWCNKDTLKVCSLIHISEPTRRTPISYA